MALFSMPTTLISFIIQLLGHLAFILYSTFPSGSYLTTESQSFLENTAFWRCFTSNYLQETLNSLLSSIFKI